MDALAAKLSQIWTTLSGVSVLWAILAVLFALAIYFLPTILAAILGNGPRRVAVIGILNLIFAWTGLGWFILLGWAMLGRPRDLDEELEASPYVHQGGTS